MVGLRRLMHECLGQLQLMNQSAKAFCWSLESPLIRGSRKDRHQGPSVIPLDLEYLSLCLTCISLSTHFFFFCCCCWRELQVIVCLLNALTESHGVEGREAEAEWRWSDRYRWGWNVNALKLLTLDWAVYSRGEALHYSALQTDIMNSENEREE